MHWTYVPAPPDSDLEQGDVLAPTEELRTILGTVHPHFCDQKYLAFTVATQSCDLVRRGSGAGARYVSIAVVRSLKEVLPRLLESVIDPVAPGLFRESARAPARDFLKRLFDQNEHNLGLFYFHHDAEVQLGEPAVAFLRIKVALRAEHYGALVRARRGRLDSEFRAKFGWLLGNLYARAASPDWADSDGGKKKLNALIDENVVERIAGAGPQWIDDELVQAGRAAGVKFADRAHADVRAELEKHRPRPRIEQVVDVAVTEAKRWFTPSDQVAQALRVKLESVRDESLAASTGSDEQLAQLRAAINKVIDAAVTEAVAGDLAGQVRVFQNKLLNSGTLRKLTK